MNMLSTIGRGLKLLLVPLALAGLAACASPFRADVSRFETQLPPPAGQTFTVVAEDPAMAGGIEMKIDRRVGGERLFEGRAQAISTSNHLQYLVPNLVDAMFTGFPGNSGETVRISIAPEDQVAQRNSGD